VALIYPGDFNTVSGKYVDAKDQKIDTKIECSLLFIPVLEDVRKWQHEIGEMVRIWIGEGTYSKK
jgi:5-methylcytosine-specific restriction enzyme subunit McrC